MYCLKSLQNSWSFVYDIISLKNTNFWHFSLLFTDTVQAQENSIRVWAVVLVE